jgi:hypothetical protein
MRAGRRPAWWASATARASGAIVAGDRVADQRPLAGTAVQSRTRQRAGRRVLPCLGCSRPRLLVCLVVAASLVLALAHHAVAASERADVAKRGLLEHAEAGHGLERRPQTPPLPLGSRRLQNGTGPLLGLTSGARRRLIAATPPPQEAHSGKHRP